MGAPPEIRRRITEAFPAPGRLSAPLRPNFLSVSRLVRLHEPRHSGKFGNAENVRRHCSFGFPGVDLQVTSRPCGRIPRRRRDARDANHAGPGSRAATTNSLYLGNRMGSRHPLESIHTALGITASSLTIFGFVTGVYTFGQLGSIGGRIDLAFGIEMSASAFILIVGMLGAAFFCLGAFMGGWGRRSTLGWVFAVGTIGALGAALIPILTSFTIQWWSLSTSDQWNMVFWGAFMLMGVLVCGSLALADEVGCPACGQLALRVQERQLLRSTSEQVPAEQGWKWVVRREYRIRKRCSACDALVTKNTVETT